MKKIFIFLSIVLILCGCSPSKTDSQSVIDDKLRIYFVDAGHGDAVILTCNGKSAMIDCGTNGNKYDSDLYNISLYLNELGITHLDYVFCTHPDKDHYSYFAELLTSNGIGNENEKLTVGEVYCSANTKEVKEDGFSEFENSFKTIFKRIKVPKEKKEFDFGTEDTKIKVLSVNHIPYDRNDKQKTSNESSIVLMVTKGNNRFLFMGDAQAATEKYLIDEYGPSGIKSDVIKIGHHGSDTSTGKAFIDIVNPKYAIISAKESDIKPIVKDNLESLGVDYFITEFTGTIICTCDGYSIKITNHAGKSLISS